MSERPQNSEFCITLAICDNVIAFSNVVF